MRPGQSSMEFLSLVSLSTVILAALYGATTSKQVEVSRYTRTQAADAVSNEVSYQVEMALVQGEGYSRVFSVPEKLAGQYYNVSVGNSNVILESEDVESIDSSRYRDSYVNLSSRKSTAYRVINNGSLYLVPAG